MKVVITSLSNTLESLIVQRFGRANYFFIHDTETGKTIFHPNCQDFGKGSGINAAQNVIV